MLTHLTFSQCVTGTPPTLTCGTPITVASNSPSGIYGSASVGDPSCKVSGDKVTDADLFAVTYTEGMVINLDMCLTAANYLSILSTDGCTELACESYGSSYIQDGTSCNGIRETTISLDDLSLTPGDTYYIKVQGVANCGGSPCSSASIAGRSYTISCDIVLANSCSNGQVMSGGGTYPIDNHNTADNSNAPNSESDNCGYSIESNLMFQWCTDVLNTQVDVQMTGVTIEQGTSVQFSVLEGPCGGPYTTIQCNSGFSTDQTIPINNTPPNGTEANTCYWLMFDGNAGTWFTMNVTLIDAQVLPVELLYFEGRSYGSYNKLSWATASETNSSHFILDRSVDFDTWHTVGRIDAMGNSSQLVGYYFNDYTITNNITYYRLTQYDFDGGFEIFNIIAIDNTEDFVNRNLHKVYDVFGRDITNTYKNYDGLKIYKYDDGHTIKTPQILE
jgi:hypothetical protein